MIIKDKVKQMLPICGTHVNLTDPIASEIFSAVGYDFIWVDMEHTVMSSEHVYHHLLAAKANNTPVFVRVPVDDLTVTKKVLEMDIDGIVFPMVKNAAHARDLIDVTLYPPYGKRGCGPKGAVKYGIESEPDYYSRKHLELCRFVQIEQKSAADEAEEIASIPFLDGCILGMHDLSGSINKLGDVFCDENIAMAKRAIDAFHRAGKTVGVSTFATDRDTLSRYYKMGINMISTGADYDYILRNAKSTLSEIKSIFQQ